jgi:hypothetical protein
MQQRQIPALPGSAPQPGAPQPAAPQPTAPPAAAPPAAAPQTDALGMLRMILTNPQFLQALQGTAAPGGQPAPPVQLPVPTRAPGRPLRSSSLPLGAVLNAIFALSGHSLTELYEQGAEDEPEVPAYLVGDDGYFLVDPASADDRAALVAHLFRLNEAARQSGRYPQLEWRDDEADEMDESEAFARAAGFP